MADEPALVARMELRLRDFEKQLKRAGGMADNGLGQVERRARTAANNIDRQFSTIGKRIGASFAGIGAIGGAGVLGALAGGLAIGAISKAADAYTNLGNRLRALGIEGEKTARTQDEIVQIALRSRTSLESVGELYTRLLSTTQELGVSQAEVGRATEIISKGFAISGASAGEAASASLQLSQAFASGVLRGEEFNAIMENSQPLAKAIAKEFGVTTGQLRAMAEAGDLVAGRVFQAIIKSGPEIEAAYSKSIPTVEQALGNLGTALATLAGKMDQSIGLSQRVSGAFTAMANTINNLVVRDPLADAVAKMQESERALGLRDGGAARPGGNRPPQPSGSTLPPSPGRAAPGSANTMWQARLEAQRKEVERLTIQRIDEVAQAAIREYGGGAQAGLDFGEGISAPGAPLPPTRPADLGRSGSKSTVATYKEIQQAADERIAQLRVEQQALGMTTAAAEAFRLEAELLNQAAQEGIKLTPKQLEDLKAKAAAYGEISAQIEQTRTKQQEMDQAIADAKGMTTNFFSGIGQDLLSGVSAVDALKDAFGRLEQQLLDMALNVLLQKLFAMLLPGAGPTNIIGGAGPMAVPTFGKATGGPISGPGTGTSDTAGLFALSNGEYVVKASAARQNRALLDAINSGTSRVTRMAAGGPVGRSSAASSSSGRGDGIVINNYGRDQVQANVRDDGITEVIIGTMQQANSQGRMNASMRGTFGVGNNRIRRGSA